MTETRRNPVLMVHGITDTMAVFHPMETHLSHLGWVVHSFDLIPNNGSFHLERLAEQVAEYIDTNFAPNQPIDVIGFSMGGIVSRYYIQRLGGVKRVQRFISISAPNHGTTVAYLSLLAGCMQMRPNSLFLQNLNADAAEILNRLNFTVIWTPYDLMIVPPESSKMSLGTEVKLPVLLHSWMLWDVRCLNAVVTALLEPLKREVSLKENRQFHSTPDLQKLPPSGNKT